MSSKLGTLSNTAILRLLEEKWHEEQKKRRFLSKIQLQEESDFGSERDSRSFSNKDSRKYWYIKRKNEELEEEKKNMLKKKGESVYKKLLDRILDLKEGYEFSEEKKLS